MKTKLLTLLALLAFAGNSVLCRLALANDEAGALEFTLLRLISGALVLCLLIQRQWVVRTDFSVGEWKAQVFPASMLFGYALSFSYAYNSLSTGAGALILFATVQVTMMAGSFIRGHQPNIYELFGMFLAMSGLAYWLIPLWGQPGLYGLLLMFLSGFCWGVYSLLGQKNKDPLKTTAMNFILTAVVALPACLVLFWGAPNFEISGKGLLLAVTSGAVTSALGYVLWYVVVSKVSAVQAAVLQLLVPVLAALGGLFWSGEPITVTLIIAGSMVFLGVLISQKK